VFQYHIGSIKTSCKVVLDFWCEKFQFHIGSIKTKGDKLSEGQKVSFNSTLVRLKQSSIGHCIPLLSCFNSTLVRLKPTKNWSI